MSVPDQSDSPSNVEVELKFTAVDLGPFRNRLIAWGAEFLGEGSQSDQYFAHPSRDFRVSDEALRVRSDGSIQVLTYKGPKTEGVAKIRTELEASFPSDPHENLEKILDALGFRRLAVVRKQRERWRAAFKGTEINIAIDQVERLGTFVEIETLTHRPGIPEAEARIREFAARLHLPDPIKTSYLALLLAAGAE